MFTLQVLALVLLTRSCSTQSACSNRSSWVGRKAFSHSETSNVYLKMTLSGQNNQSPERLMRMEFWRTYYYILSEGIYLLL